MSAEPACRGVPDLAGLFSYVRVIANLVCVPVAAAAARTARSSPAVRAVLSAASNFGALGDEHRAHLRHTQDERPHI